MEQPGFLWVFHNSVVSQVWALLGQTGDGSCVLGLVLHRTQSLVSHWSSLSSFPSPAGHNPMGWRRHLMTLTLKVLKMEQQLSTGETQRPLCHCWEKPGGEKSAFNRGLAWFEAWPRSSGSTKEGVMANVDSPLLEEPNLFILMITRVLCSVQTCLELQKQLQGVARCTKNYIRNCPNWNNLKRV